MSVTVSPVDNQTLTVDYNTSNIPPKGFINSQGTQLSSTRSILTPTVGLGSVPACVFVLTAIGTSNNTTSSETNLFAGGTGVPAMTTVQSLLGIPIPANFFVIGRVVRLELWGNYTTNGATATITPQLYFNTVAASTKIGTGIASGTFASGAGLNTFKYDVMLVMISATAIVTTGTVFLGGSNPATTVTGLPSLASAVAGVTIVPTSVGNISASWTGSSNNAGNVFQLTGALMTLIN